MITHDYYGLQPQPDSVEIDSRSNLESLSGVHPCREFIPAGVGEMVRLTVFYAIYTLATAACLFFGSETVRMLAGVLVLVAAPSLWVAARNEWTRQAAITFRS